MAELTEAQVIVGAMPKMYEITDELRDVYALLASPDAEIDPSTGEVGEDKQEAQRHAQQEAHHVADELLVSRSHVTRPAGPGVRPSGA